MTLFYGSVGEEIIALLRLVAKEIGVTNRLLLEISQKESQSMSIQEDLANAVATLSSNLDAHDVAIQAELVALKDALAAGNPSAIQAAITNISAISSKITGETKQLTDSLPVAPPVVTPEPTPAPVTPPSDTPPTA